MERGLFIIISVFFFLRLLPIGICPLVREGVFGKLRFVLRINFSDFFVQGKGGVVAFILCMANLYQLLMDK